MTAERDGWQTVADSERAEVLKLQAKCASLQAQIVATAWVRHADPVEP